MRIHHGGGGRRKATRAGMLLAALIAGAASLGSELAAQNGHGAHRVTVGGTRPEGVTTVSPRTGAPGSEIEVTAEGLPAGHPVQVMIGALNSGFEVLAHTVTDAEGRISADGSVTVAVPDWVENDRLYLLIVTDRSYNPLATADAFHATGEEGTILREGWIEHAGPGCPALMNDAQELYFLSGSGLQVSEGDPVVVEGSITEEELCGNGLTIVVTRLEKQPVR